MKASRLKSLAVIYLVGVLGLYATVAWNARHLIAAGFPDFAIYYCAGTVVRQGLGHQLYDTVPRFEVQQQFATAVPMFRGPLPWTHPPFEALFFVPFSYFPYLTAYALWNLLNLVLVGATLWLLPPYLPHLQSRAPALWLLAIAFFPVFFNLMDGQDAIVILFLYALAFVFLCKNHDAAAGAFLALGLFKFHLVLPFVLLLLVQKRWKVLYGFLPVSLLTVLASIAIAGVRAFWAYPRYVFYWENVLEGKDRVPAGMPNLRGLMYVFPPGWRYAGPLLLLLSLALLFFVARRCRSMRSAAAFDLNFSLALVATLLVSYHVVNYDLSVLLIPVFLLANYLFEEGNLHRWSLVIIALGIALLFCAPLELFLSLKHKEFALMGFVLILWMYGILEETSLRLRN
jgi:hypothetical protein